MLGLHPQKQPPFEVAVFQTILQAFETLSGLMVRLNSSGMPIVLSTAKAAPLGLGQGSYRAIDDGLIVIEDDLSAF